MNKNIYIRKLVSFFLICLFAISATPVILVHDLVANHKDIGYNNFSKHDAQYSKAGINCHCKGLVTEAQFLNTFNRFHFIKPNNFSVLNTFYPTKNHSFFKIFTALRGPPSWA